jgi:hypothetical protein
MNKNTVGLFEQLAALCSKITFDTRFRLNSTGLSCKANMENAKAEYTIGRTYAKIMQGDSVRYFVRLNDGMIFASKSWQAANFNRSYGTLDTIDQFDWGNYNPVAYDGTDFKMVGTSMGYMTAVAK